MRSPTPADITLLLILGAFAVVVPLQSIPAFALSYSDWIQENETWKRGYVFGVAEHMKTMYWSQDQIALTKAYERCLVGFSDKALVKTVDEYLTRNPSSKTKSLITVINNSFFELCSEHIPKEYK